MNRTTYACRRCFKQKRKCDNKSPSCSRCLQAGTECVGLDRQTSAPVPRSLVQHLEQKVAALESELAFRTSQTSDLNHQDLQYLQSPDSRLIDIYIGNLAADSGEKETTLQSLVTDITINVLSSPSDLPLLSSWHGERFEWLQSKASQSNISLGAIPRNVAEILVRVYVDKILPQYPFFLAEQIWSHFDTAYSKDSSQVSGIPISVYIISMVMAISTMTSKAADIEKPMAFSDALYHFAMDYYRLLASNSLDTLQATMLICQFANFRPASANIWRAKDIAFSMAIGLGLHSQSRSVYDIDSRTMKLRAQVFWVLYSMDRSITVPTMRPLGILDEHIDVALPQELDNNDNSLSSAPEDVYARRRRQQWINHVRLRQLQSEIYAVNFGEADLSGRTHETWMNEMDQRLHLWKNDVVGISESGPDWFEFVMSTVQFYLHMPCPRNPDPAEPSKLICFDAASTTLYGYLGMIQSGFLKFDWHCAHQCCTSASLVLDNAQLFTRLLSNTRVAALLDQFSEVFTLLARRWPACIVVSERFEERRSVLHLTSLPAAGLNQTLNATAEDAADVMEAVKLHADGVHETLHSSLTAEFPGFDDTTYWGPLDDSFQAFVDMDWNAMGSQDDFLDWAM